MSHYLLPLAHFFLVFKAAAVVAFHQMKWITLGICLIVSTAGIGTKAGARWVQYVAIFFIGILCLFAHAVSTVLDPQPLVPPDIRLLAGIPSMIFAAAVAFLATEFWPEEWRFKQDE